MSPPRRRAAAAGVAVLLALAPAACGGDDGAGDAAVRDDPPPAAGSAPAATQEGDTTAAADTADGSGGRTLTTIDVAGHPVRVEIADEDDERERGLMHRDSLPPGQGMLFVYPEEQTLSFWMRNTTIALDIAFVDRRGYIVDIQHMDPHTEKLHRSSDPAMYALEVRRGWLEAHGVEEGDRVRF